MADNYVVVTTEGNRTFRAKEVEGILYPIHANEDIGNISDTAVYGDGENGSVIALLKGLLSYFNGANQGPLYDSNYNTAAEGANVTAGFIRGQTNSNNNYNPFWHAAGSGVEHPYLDLINENIGLKSNDQGNLTLSALMRYGLIDSGNTTPWLENLSHVLGGDGTDSDYNINDALWYALFQDDEETGFETLPLLRFLKVLGLKTDDPSYDLLGSDVSMTTILKSIYGQLNGDADGYQSQGSAYYTGEYGPKRPYLEYIMHALGAVEVSNSNMTINDLLYNNSNQSPYLKEISDSVASDGWELDPTASDTPMVWFMRGVAGLLSGDINGNKAGGVYNPFWDVDKPFLSELSGTRDLYGYMDDSYTEYVDDSSVSLMQVMKGILAQLNGVGRSTLTGNENAFFMQGSQEGKAFLRSILEALGDAQTNASGVAINDLLWDSPNTQPYLKSVWEMLRNPVSTFPFLQEIYDMLYDVGNAQPQLLTINSNLESLNATIGTVADTPASGSADAVSLMSHIKYQSSLLEQMVINTTP